MVIDNLSSHEVVDVCEAPAAALLFLPAYAPGLSPIEQAAPSSSRCREETRRAAARPGGYAR